MSVLPGTDSQLRPVSEKIPNLNVFQNSGCFTKQELDIIDLESQKDINQISPDIIQTILRRLQQHNTGSCPGLTAREASSISNFFCLTQPELIRIRSDAQKLPDILGKQRIDTILNRIKQAQSSRCEFAVQDINLFKKFVFLLEIEKTLQTPQTCFSQQQIADIIQTVKSILHTFTDPELSFLIRSIQRNNTKIQRARTENDQFALSQGHCSIYLDSQQLFNNLLIAIKLEREKRLAAGVPKTVGQRTRLDILSEEATIRNQLENTKAKLPNLTLNQISINVSKTILGVLDDLLTKPVGVSQLDHLISTFTKDSRPIYLGVILIIVSIFVSLFRNLK